MLEIVKRLLKKRIPLGLLIPLLTFFKRTGLFFGIFMIELGSSFMIDTESLAYLSAEITLKSFQKLLKEN